jgi:hypothetical protein
MIDGNHGRKKVQFLRLSTERSVDLQNISIGHDFIDQRKKLRYL